MSRPSNLPLSRMSPAIVTRAILTVVLCGLPLGAAAQPAEPEPRRQFVTLSLDRMHTLSLNFDEHPLSDLTGLPVSATQSGEVDYRSDDGSTDVTVREFRRQNRGASITIYPLGARNGVTLAVKGSYQELPVTRLTIAGPAGVELYDLADGRAFDLGAGMIVNDRSPGWGLGAHSYILAGVGRIRSEALGNGRRLFAEGGGGLTVGPFGVQLGVQFAWNELRRPREHRFLTVPITLRAIVSF